LKVAKYRFFSAAARNTFSDRSEIWDAHLPFGAQTTMSSSETCYRHELRLQNPVLWVPLFTGVDNRYPVGQAPPGDLGVTDAL
jgi:hypothetical protein